MSLTTPPRLGPTVAACCALWLTACGGSTPPPLLQRDQLFFSADAPDALVLVLVLQREHIGQGGVMELKGFIADDQGWRQPFYDRQRLSRWPGDDVAAAVRAWEPSPSLPLRLEWSDAAEIKLSVRNPSGGLSLGVQAGVPISGHGPHGALSWRAGRATASVNSRDYAGVGVWERLRDGTPLPRFDSFELWVLSPPEGGLLLGRRPARGAGSALSVAPDGGAASVPFSATPTLRRPNGLPRAWTVAHHELTRVGGQTTSGTNRDGQPARYDLSAVIGRGSHGLVFHLEDHAE